MISYSKDGENWPNPTEVFVPKNNGSKVSAPYICITDTDQLIKMQNNFTEYSFKFKNFKEYFQIS